MEYIRFVFLGLLFIFSSIHLFRSWQDNKKKRPLTKWTLLLCLIGYFVFAGCEVNYLYWLLLTALITSWLGDVLLIPQGIKWFIIGGCSFLVTHITLVVLYALQIDFSMRCLWAIPVAIAYYGFAGWVIKKLSKYAKTPFRISLLAYLCCNATMNVFAFMLLLTNPCFATAVAFIGALLFFASDCSLFFVKLHENKNLIFKKHFTVMLTYILGELLITIGMVMLNK